MQFKIEFQVADLERMAEVIKQEIATPEQMLGSIGESLLRTNNERHDQGLAPDGTPWKPLSPLTIGTLVKKTQNETFNKTKGYLSIGQARKIQGRKRILRASGDMLSSLNYQVSGSELTLGFDGAREAKLAGWHHGGTKPYTIKPRAKKALAFAGIVTKRVSHPGLPKRPLLGFPESDQRLVVDVVEDHLTLLIQGRG